LDGTDVPTVSGAEPDHDVTVSATAIDADGHVWRSHAEFTPHANGTVNLGDLPRSGSYSGAHATGLLWSMTSPGVKAFHLPRGLAMSVTWTATGSGRRAPALTQKRVLTDPGVTEKSLTASSDGFVAELYEPAATAKPASPVVLVGGSEGGLGGPTLQAAALASHGHPALALAYFGLPGLPTTLTDVPLEYFAKALTWFSRQPGVDPRNITMVGGSRGSEAALLMGVDYPGLVRNVVAASPSSFVNTGLPDTSRAAWTWHGRPVPHASVNDFGTVTPGEPASAIPVQRIRGRVLVLCGQDDLLWPSCPSSDRIAEEVGSRAVKVEEPEAGHLIDFPLPNLPLAPGAETNDLGTVSEGGSVQADAVGRLDAWPRLLAFLEH
jgi:pimeloyl-ACP methyl ester carboxylesterase